MMNLKCLKEISNDKKLFYLIMDITIGLSIGLIKFGYDLNRLENKEERINE